MQLVFPPAGSPSCPPGSLGHFLGRCWICNVGCKGYVLRVKPEAYGVSCHGLKSLVQGVFIA